MIIIEKINFKGLLSPVTKQKCCPIVCFSHDVTKAVLVSQNNKTVAMLVSQTSPVRVKLFSYMETLSFFPINLNRRWPRKWKHSIVWLSRETHQASMFAKLQDYFRLANKGMRGEQFLKFPSHPAQSNLLFQGLNKISESNGQEQLELHNVW